MENKQSYFSEIWYAIKSLLTGLRVTLKEYFTPKSTEQYPENRKTTLHVAQRHRGRLVFKRNEDGTHNCVACTMCEKACPNETILIKSEMVVNEETGRKKKQLVDYQYKLGDCMFCQLCVNSCNFNAIEFTNDFENSVFERDSLTMHLDKEVYQGGSLPGLIDGGAPLTIGQFNTKTK